MSLHNFNIEIAKDLKFGAAFIHNLAMWIEKNAANNKHFYDGHYWTYNSLEAFLKLFPYLTKDELRTIIKNAVDKGYIIKGNYNKNPYDRTMWYALTEKSIKHYKNLQEIINSNNQNLINNDENIDDLENDLEIKNKQKPLNDASRLDEGNFPHKKGENPTTLKKHIKTHINKNIIINNNTKNHEQNEKKFNNQNKIITPIYKDLTKDPESHPHDTPEIREAHFKKLGIATSFDKINFDDCKDPIIKNKIEKLVNKFAKQDKKCA
jgi:hypothetical protein